MALQLQIQYSIIPYSSDLRGRETEGREKKTLEKGQLRSSMTCSEDSCHILDVSGAQTLDGGVSWSTKNEVAISGLLVAIRLPMLLYW